MFMGRYAAILYAALVLTIGYWAGITTIPWVFFVRMHLRLCLRGWWRDPTWSIGTKSSEGEESLGRPFTVALQNFKTAAGSGLKKTFRSTRDGARLGTSFERLFREEAMKYATDNKREREYPEDPQ